MIITFRVLDIQLFIIISFCNNNYATNLVIIKIIWSSYVQSNSDYEIPSSLEHIEWKLNILLN